MKRKVFLTVEATGLDEAEDRIVEIIALEVIDSKLTGVQFHMMLDPEHPMAEDAQWVSGYEDAQLMGLPIWRDAVGSFLGFVKDAHLIIFNTRWTLELVNAELARCGISLLTHHVPKITDMKSEIGKLNLPFRPSIEKLSQVLECRNPVQFCSDAWKECFLTVQIFQTLNLEETSSMNIVELETAVPVHDGPHGTPYIEIETIPEPWRSQFIRWLCAGEVIGNELMYRCQLQQWKDWLYQSPAHCPELAPSQLDEFPFIWSDVREAMKQGLERAQSHLQGRFVHYPDDLMREIRCQAALATYGAQEKTLQKAYIRGFLKGLTKDLP